LEAQSHGVVHDEVHLNELTYHAEEHMYTQPCRCGGEYALTDQDVSIGADIALCSSCSLRLKIILGRHSSRARSLAYWEKSS
ncbi:hypothetical protein IWQ61_010242, partial [Dispira simplex]